MSSTSSILLSGASPGSSLLTSALPPAQPTPTPPPSTLLPGGGPPIDENNCKLLGPFALFVQALMGLLVVGSLVLKRQRERPKRPWKIWSLDISKQMLGQLFVHTLNIVLSDAVAHHGKSNPCSLYFLNIAIDTTLGVFVIYITLRITTHVLTSVLGWHGFVSGQYGNIPTPEGGSGKPKMSYWGKQLATYLFAIFVMKIFVTGIMWLFPVISSFGKWVLSLFGRHRNAQVLFVMALFPLAMNVLQFWLIDSLLRHNPNTSVYAKLNSSGIAEDDSEGSDAAGADGHNSWRGIGRPSYEEEEGAAGGPSSSRRRLGGSDGTSHASDTIKSDPYRIAEGGFQQSRANLMDTQDPEGEFGGHMQRSGSGSRNFSKGTKLHMDDSEQRPASGVASPASGSIKNGIGARHSRESSARR
ncbi:hypothetical protein OC846_002351 [Tilletia horrida]|uniref:Vacuolar membrane protein n=1 Tax=Tilletia horrida TaxID=155126 RepID=A0AAN6GS68_9BASI|nr:hypothetical protein OC845_002481 [Tilletia horrida]KAK0553820.1 hypothetical protein OC846_002351 [Tilletia horrida]KAK0567783.1 hypothetical protein OC861_002526 [Tilletia horrida]